jgi:lipopolysaccharide cholinephosphotransferase
MTKEEFLKEELRDDYLVTSDMKKVWYIELDILKEFIRVCNKYNLKYFADGGTLLGVIRHKGFIPWDDDIDIAMLREDYDELVKIGPKEFKHPYFFQTPYTDKYYYQAHAKIRNSNTTEMAKYEFNKKYNRGIFIDIFPLDNLPDNNKYFVVQQRQIRFFYKLFTNHFRYDRVKNKTFKRNFVHFLVNIFFTFVSYPYLYKCFEKVCSKYNNISTSKIGLLSFLPDDSRFYNRRESYHTSTMMPFEDIELPVPIGYDDILRLGYGNYMEPARNVNWHSEAIFDTEISYIDYVNKHNQFY